MDRPERPEDDQYPSDEELAYIASWPLENSVKDLFEYVVSIWNYPDFAAIEKVRSDLGWDAYQITLITGGWSGNESILGALEQAGDTMMWNIFWLESRRGGYNKFEVSENNWQNWGNTPDPI